MRSCLLRAALSHTDGSSTFVLGNPKAWLGVAYHEVLEKFVYGEIAAETFDSTVENLWNKATVRQYQSASRHPLNHRFGPAETWPGYHVVRASVRLRAHELIASSIATRVSGPGSGGRTSTTMREQEFTACNGKLVGRPDVVRGAEILDYKTGEIYERTGNETNTTLKASYIRQLQLYGFLVSSTVGTPIHRGVLLPMMGEPVDVELDESVGAKEAKVAIALLDRYNNLVESGASTQDLASPSPENCCWCPFKIICPALWGVVNESWLGKLEGEVLRGTVADNAELLISGRGFSLAVFGKSGTVKCGRHELFPLSVDWHAGVDKLLAGDLIRSVGLGRRPDGNLFPSIRTVLVKEEDGPKIIASSSPKKRKLQRGMNSQRYGRN